MQNNENINFWQKLSQDNPLGFVGLSPMDGVTDLPMRIMAAKYGRPDVIFTEFVNVEGLTRGAKVLRKQLWVKPELEGNVVAQLYGLRPDNFRQIAEEIKDAGFVGIDINMGCPAKNVAQNGAGAGLIKNKALAKEIFLATKEGAPNLPVSIKTRTGTYQPEIENWLGWVLEELKPAALTVHGRTYQQGYAGLADWEVIAAVAELSKTLSPETIMMGNGDVKNRAKAEKRVLESGVNGCLIGRAAMSDPAVFGRRVENWCELKNVDETSKNDIIEDKFFYLKIALEHARLFEKTFSGEEKYNFLPMRKHLAWYAKGFEGAAEMRVALTQANSAEEVENILKRFF